jgi:hypothetical protein
VYSYFLLTYNLLMNDDPNFIVKARDLASIIQNPDRSVIEELLEAPGAVFAALLTDLFTSGHVALFGPAVRIVQGAFKGEVYKQFGAEVRSLREKGTLRSDFEDNSSGYQTWVELLSIIDSETPDEGRLEALKAMFLATNRINASDGEKILGYQLFQIAKRLTSNELLVLKATFGLQVSNQFTAARLNQRDWVKDVAHALGHNLSALVRHAEKVLVEAELLDPAVNFSVPGHRLTDLGTTFCKNIETYRLELNRVKKQ